MENQGGIASDEVSNEFSLAHLSDDALLGELGRVNRAHKAATAELVAHIAEVDARKLYLVQASPSMFAYCVERLGCSEDEACRRIDAARIARKWPVILGKLAAGEISLSVLSKLKSFLNDANVGDLLDAVARKSVREAERVLAARFPKPDTADSIRRLPESKSSKAGHGSRSPRIPIDADAGAATARDGDVLAAMTARAIETDVGTTPDSLIEAERLKLETGAAQVRPWSADTRVAERPIDRGRVQPLSAERIQVKFTASRALEEKLELARDLMSHGNPRGDLATIIEAALDVLIAERLKKKLGQTKRAQKQARPAKRSRITSAARREVVERDGLACSFVDTDGRRCGARAFLELDHVDPKGKGGTGAPEKVRLLCRGHNQLEAERAYGKEFMERKRREGKKGALTVREIGVRERFVVGLGDPRWRGYSSSAGRTTSISRDARTDDCSVPSVTSVHDLRIRVAWHGCWMGAGREAGRGNLPRRAFRDSGGDFGTRDHRSRARFGSSHGFVVVMARWRKRKESLGSGLQMARHARPSSTGTRRAVSGGKRSKSSASSARSRRVRHVVCVDNEGYETSLEPRKIYSVLADAPAQRLGMVRVIDESGEDYLFPKEHFADIKLPAGLAKALGAST